MASITPVVRPRSPEAAAGSERKRKRKVLSCYDCRRRKLQCDRTMPACGRCTKAGQASSCLYLDDNAEAPVVSTSSSAPVDLHTNQPVQPTESPPLSEALSRLEFQERRIKQLESALAHANHAPTSDPMLRLKAAKLPLIPDSVIVNGDISSAPVPDRETMLLRGKSFKTQFHGNTHATSLIALIPDLNLFTQEAFEKFPALSRIRQDMHALEERVEYAGSEPSQTTDDELKGLLPSKNEADYLVRLYLDSYGQLYHILHLPSFWRQYSEMWSDLKSTSVHFVALILLMMAAAQCLASTQPWLYTANSSVAREKSMTSIQACDDWLRMQSQKHVTVTDFQIRFLLILASKVSAGKFKRTWTDTGALIRFFMAAGLHRSPDHIRKPTTALDKEIRRRLWAAATELELQVSFDRGMLASPWPAQSDAPPPSNIHDEDLQPESTHLPRQVDMAEFTPSSFLSIANESIMLRHALNTRLNSIKLVSTFEEVKQLTEEIDAHLSNIPDWVGSSAEVPKALLSLNLHQYLLELHNRQLRQAKSKTERDFSNMVILDTATHIINTLRRVSEAGFHVLDMMCSHHLRAALSICHVTTSPDVGPDNAMGHIVQTNAVGLIQQAVDLLNEKVIRFGREQRQMWIALAAHGYCKTRIDPSQREVYMQEAVDKIARPYYKILASQKDVPLAVGAPGDHSSKESDTGTLEYMPPVSNFGIAPDGTSEGMPLLFDLEDTEAWTFENFFGPGGLPETFEDSFQVAEA